MTNSKYLRHQKIWSDMPRDDSKPEKIDSKDLKRVKLSSTNNGKAKSDKRKDS